MQMRRGARKTFTVAACLSAVALLLMAGLPATAGARVVISGGEARLTIDRGLTRELRREGIDIAGIGAGTAGGRLITLPVVAGATNGAAGRGALTVAGGFSFGSGARAARIDDILLNTGKGQSTARIAGMRRILAKHDALRARPVGFDTRIRISNLRLTDGTAAALNRRLGLPGVFRPGRRLGSLVVVAIPANVEIDFGTIAMGGPDTAFSRLESLGVQMGIWGGSERWAAPGETYFLFPVEPAMVAPDASAGILESEPDDGVSMEIHAPPPRNMLLREPRVDLAARELSARVSALSAEDPGVIGTIATLDYGAAKFQVRPRVGAFELMGIRAVANQFIADQLNSRFATNQFQPGETLARLTVTLHAPVSG
jgi:hypothetical protein